MKLLFFHVQDYTTQPDIEGTELAGLSEAKYEAVRLAGSMMLNEIEMFLDGKDWSIHVTDAKGSKLFSYTIQGLDPSSATINPT